MKKVCAIMLAAAMMLTMIPAAAFAEGEGRSFLDFLLGETSENQQAPVPAAEAGIPVTVVKEEPEKDVEELLVGHPTITKGDFFTEMMNGNLGCSFSTERILICLCAKRLAAPERTNISSSIES